MEYSYLKKYIVQTEFEDNGEKHVFYPVSEQEILESEQRMEKKIPDALKQFYECVGYGYFEDKDECFINLLMNPKRIADFYCSEGDYYYAEERQFLGSDDFVFFEFDSNCHIIIKTGEMDSGKIYFGKRLIADSLSEFVERLSRESNYFIQD